MGSVMGTLGHRMWQFGVRDSAEYFLLAEENRISLRLVAPVRGRIFDRTGKIVADNEQTFRVALIPEEARDLETVLVNLSTLLDLGGESLAKIRDQIDRAPGFVPITVKDRITWEELSIVALNTPALPGVHPEMVLSRVYPFGPDFAHQVGYVGPVSDKDLVADGGELDPILRLPDYQIGKIGIERSNESFLRGISGIRRVEVNAGGRTMRELALQAPAPGPDMQITLDHHLQNFMRVRLEGQSAAAIVMDVKNGDLLGCTSAPSFDPNLFVRGISSRDYNTLRENEYRPLSDKSVQDLPLLGLAHGNNPSRAWKRERFGEDWLIGDTINASIGQGFTLASPIQLATMTARIASGRAVLPRLVRPFGSTKTETPVSEVLGLRDEALALVRQGMFQVSNDKRGTAYASRIADPAMSMAGKTGTSQVFSISKAERAAGVRSQSELPWNRRDHALFVAFAPVEAPRYAVTVVVEHGGGGSKVAAPIARDILLFAQIGGLPPADAYPSSQRTQVQDELAVLSKRILRPDSTPSMTSPT